MDEHYTSLPFLDIFPTEKKKDSGKRKRNEEASNNTENRWPNKRGQQSQPHSSLGKKHEHCAASRSNSQSASEHSSGTTQGSHSYNLWLQKQTLYKNCVESLDTEISADDCNSNCTERGPHITGSLAQLKTEGSILHCLKPHELEVVRRTLMHTTMPLWVDRVPQNLGAASHGSLKAAEWLFLYKVYYTIALVPIWRKAYAECTTAEEKEQVTILLESTTLLSKITHFLQFPQIHKTDLPELDDLIKN